MSVVNCKVKFIRPKYNDLKEWCEDNNNVYIGRRGVVFIDKQRYPSDENIWANPFKVGKHGTREQVIEKYRRMINQSPELMKELELLRGKNLGCWCAPERCHGDVLLEILNK